jgi:hypothetical protein
MFPSGLLQVKELAKYTLFNLGRCFEGAGYGKEAVATYLQLCAICRKEVDELDGLDLDDFRTDGKTTSNRMVNAWTMN